MDKERHATHTRFGFAIVLLAFVLSAGTLPAHDWTPKDSGVGLVVQAADYDKVLKIAERGDAWDLEHLYANGALANRYKGNQGFAAWLVGSHTETFLNKNGLPVWNYRYKLTSPGGKTYESGLAGFHVPGFAVVGISIGGDTSGTGKVEWFIVNRDTNEVRLVGTSQFTTTW